jgi:hypothetical protein
LDPRYALTVLQHKAAEKQNFREELVTTHFGNATKTFGVSWTAFHVATAGTDKYDLKLRIFWGVLPCS